MSYIKQTWEDLPSLNTPITAARLNHIEDGIAEAWEHGGSGVGETLRIGTILPYTGSGSNLPVGYMLCNGTALSRTTYAELFNVIGTSFGAGDGSTTFNLPDLKGKVLTGLDENDTDFNTLGETGGEKTHTLTTSEMPSHYHTAGKYDALGINHASVATGSGATSLVASGSTTSTHVITNNSGGDQAHNNLQPYVVVNYIIKVMETTPTAAQIVGIYTESDSDGYSTNYVNRFGKTLWEGSFTTGTLTIPHLNEYSLICVFAGGLVMVGNQSYGGLTFRAWRSTSFASYGYRFTYNATNNTLTTDSDNPGVSDGANQITITKIVGVF